MNPVCGQCSISMTCKRTGIFVVQKSDMSHALAGDLFRCPVCGAEIINNFACEQTPIHLDKIPRELIFFLDE